ncbi:hypothetical protein [Streptomyces sp. ALB3]|uniref:hypothetical protein n=1 Tax=Streptomyces sp. ALB3 TaxID=3374278 RepID=UPI0037A1681F
MRPDQHGQALFQHSSLLTQLLDAVSQYPHREPGGPHHRICLLAAFAQLQVGNRETTARQTPQLFPDAWIGRDQDRLNHSKVHRTDRDGTFHTLWGGDRTETES